MSRACSIVLVAIVLLGITLRIAEWGHSQPFWTDEALLLINLVDLKFADAFAPLSNNQSAPPLFVLTVLASIDLLGWIEPAARLPAICGSLATVVLTVVVARAWLPPAGVAVAAAIVSFSPVLIFFAGEAKQYAIEAAVTLAILWTAIRFHSLPSVPRGIGICLAGIVSIWLALPALLVLPAVWLSLIYGISCTRADRKTFGETTAICAVAWTVSAAVLYLTVLRHTREDPFLTSFWADAMLPRPATPVAVAAWVPRQVWRLMWSPMGMDPSVGRVALLILLCFGVFSVSQKKRGESTRNHVGLILLVSPLLLGVLAAFLRLYPMASRLWVFAVPILAILAAKGVVRLWGVASQGVAQFLTRSVATVLTCVVLGGLIASSSPPGHKAGWPIDPSTGFGSSATASIRRRGTRAGGSRERSGNPHPAMRSSRRATQDRHGC